MAVLSPLDHDELMRLRDLEHKPVRTRAEQTEFETLFERATLLRQRGMRMAAHTLEGVEGYGEQISNRSAGYGQPTPSWGEPGLREIAPGEYSRLFSQTGAGMVTRARRLIDNLHGRHLIPDQGASALARMVGVDDEHEAWRAAEMVSILGSDEYVEAFMTALMGSSRGMTLISDRQRDLLARGRAMSLGIGSQGGFAVPFQLDPALILTSAGTVDPMRQIARVEQGQAKEFDLVTTAGVTSAYVAEGTEAGTGDPLLVQPVIKPYRQQSFVPFSIELDTSWTAAVAQLTNLLTDAADLLDAQVHISGSGTAPLPQGVVIGMQGAANNILTAVAGTVTLNDIYALQRAVPPRFRPKSTFIMNLALIQACQQFQPVVGQSAIRGTAQSVEVEGGGGQLTLVSDPLYEASYMSSGISTTGQVIAVAGSFREAYCVYDLLPTRVELIPHLFGPVRNFPTGTRGLYMYRFSGALVHNPAALACLTVR